MTSFIVLVGVAIATVGAYGVVRPTMLVELVNSTWESPRAFPFAIVFRFALGIVLWVAAPECRHPDVVRVLGAIAVVAAIAALVLGRERIERFLVWWMERAAAFIRGWATVAIAFGGFLIYTAT